MSQVNGIVSRKGIANNTWKKSLCIQHEKALKRKSPVILETYTGMDLDIVFVPCRLTPMAAYAQIF